jgi:hypothetical protein
VRRDLDSEDVDPLVVFRKYGSHFLREYIVGGRMDYSCATDVTKLKSSKKISAQAQMAY